MATNKYFINYNSRYEQGLIEDLVVETIKIHGFDMYYLPRELNSQPDIFGDDPISSFRQHFIVEMYLQSVDGFEGDGDFIGKFGLEIRDSATFVVSKKRFQNVTDKFRPMEGDILWFPLTKKFFEIKFVEHENPFYQLGKNYVYSLNVELFQYSEETIDTQIDTIDDAVDIKEFTKTLTVGTPIGSGTFSSGDSVYTFENGATAGSLTAADSSATVFGYSTGSLVLKDTVGYWRGTTGGVDRYVMKDGGSLYAKILSSTTKTDEEDFNDNDIIEDQANEFLDFSELNPFGDLT
jgi:hypothetical protein